jgi:hypothetical protein
MRTVSIQVGLDRFIYGNSFTSMYMAFARILTCRKCGNSTSAKQAPGLSFSNATGTAEMHMKCERCGTLGAVDVKDRYLKGQKSYKVIRWDPKFMYIDYDPITDHHVYYWEFPPDIVTKVKKGNRLLLETYPMEFLRAAITGKLLKFRDNKIFHMKYPAPAGVHSGWGLPPILSALGSYFYLAILRRANESIALERILSLRILYPEQTASGQDPLAFINMGNWTGRMEESLRMWRRDPNYIQFSPFPVGVANVGGDGRALMVLGEIQEASKDVIVSLGVPETFVIGGMNIKEGDINLRMLENTLRFLSSDLNEHIDWCSSEVSQRENIEDVDIKYKDLKLVDDMITRQLLLQKGNEGKISAQREGEVIGYDWKDEYEKIKEETVAKAKMDMEMQKEITKIQSSISQQAMAAAGQTSTYNQQEIIAQADNIVAELQQYPYEDRKSHLAQLQNEDYVLWSVVSHRLETANNQQQREAASSMDPAAGGGAPMM